MTRLRMAIAILLLCPTFAFAQAGSICLYSDVAGTQCDFATAPGLLNIYVVHEYAPGATGSQFWAPQPACMTADFIADSSPYIIVGTSQTGVSVGYMSCRVAPVHILTISYLVNGAIGVNCPYPVLPDPTKTHVEVVDCSYNLLYGFGGTAYLNSSISCDCPNLPSPPVLEISPTVFNLAASGSAGTVNVSNVGAGTLNWNASVNPAAAAWLSIVPTSGVGDGAIDFTVDRTGIAQGDYTGTITVASNGGTASATVTMTVLPTGPVLTVEPTYISFGSTGTTSAFTIRNTGVGTLSWAIEEDAPWLTASPDSGFNNGTVTLTADRTGLPPGSYGVIVHVNSNVDTRNVTVVMTVDQDLAVSPTALTFAYNQTALAFHIYNNGSGTLNWQITSNQPWVTTDPTAGTDGANVQVNVDRTGLAEGVYHAVLTVTSNSGSATVNITMHVVTSPILVVNPTTLVFFQPGTKTFTINNGGVGSLEWDLMPDEPWIVIDPPLSGVGFALVPVHIDQSQMPEPGAPQTGHITVASNGGTVAVTVQYTPPGAGNAGIVGVYADQYGLQCDIHVTASQPLNLYVVHTLTTGAKGVQFKAPKPACMTASIWLADNIPHPVSIGNSQTGIAVAYGGGCTVGPIHVVTMQFFTGDSGPGPACCNYPVSPDPNVPSGSIEAVNCADQIMYPIAGSSVVNPDGGCGCYIALPTEETTWGRLKSLYAPRE